MFSLKVSPTKMIFVIQHLYFIKIRYDLFECARDYLNFSHFSGYKTDDITVTGDS